MTDLEYDKIAQAAQQDFSQALLPTAPPPGTARIGSAEMANIAVECKDLMMLYTCAMKEVRTRFEILNAEYGVRYQRNPIHSISTRLKGSASIVEKLHRKGLSLTPENIRNHIFDVAGIRVICFYEDDIFSLANAITSQDGITLRKAKDYISKPKPNGYRSLHLILDVPFSLSNSTETISVEVQIRTVVMDAWASMEHQLKYKFHGTVDEDTVSQLKLCAEAISMTDHRMMEIRQEIEAGNERSESELLLEKIRKMDHPLE